MRAYFDTKEFHSSLIMNIFVPSKKSPLGDATIMIIFIRVCQNSACKLTPPPILHKIGILWPYNNGP